MLIQLKQASADFFGNDTTKTPPTNNYTALGKRIINLATPVLSTDAATKGYVDTAITAAINGITWKAPARVATTGILPNSPLPPVFTVGGSAVITAGSNGAIAIDGVNPLSLNDRVLVKNEGDVGGLGAEFNGIYEVTQVGNAGAPYILTRTADADTDAEVVAGLALVVTEGTANADTTWLLTTDNPISLNVTSLTFSTFPFAIPYAIPADLRRTNYQNDIGVSTNVARADHAHAAPRRVLADKNLTASTSTGTGTQVGPAISYTPAFGLDPQLNAQNQAGYVRVTINGVSYRLGNGSNALDVYFADSASPGTPLNINAIKGSVDQSADHRLYRGSGLGFETDTNDIVEYEYDAFY